MATPKNAPPPTPTTWRRSLAGFGFVCVALAGMAWAISSQYDTISAKDDAEHSEVDDHGEETDHSEETEDHGEDADAEGEH